MRITNINPARPEFYDRAVRNRVLRYYTGSVAPHTSTLLLTYTVPSGAKAYVDYLIFQAYLDGIPTTPRNALIRLEYQPSGSGPVSVLVMNHMSRELNVITSMGPVALGYLLSGDVINIYTSDDSTGGTVTYLIAAKIFEFTA